MLIGYRFKDIRHVIFGYFIIMYGICHYVFNSKPYLLSAFLLDTYRVLKNHLLPYPTIVCMHCCVPFTLVPLFHIWNILLKPFSMFVKNCLTICEKKVQKVGFRWHVTSYILVGLDEVFHQFFIVFFLSVFEKSLRHTLECLSSSFLLPMKDWFKITIFKKALESKDQGKLLIS